MILQNRNEFGRLFKEMGLDSGVEVGVKTGDFSVEILKKWSGKFYLVDAWRHLENYVDTANVSDAEHERNYRYVVDRFKNVATVEVVRSLSVEAAGRFKDAELGWVYLDGNHSKKAVEADLKAWWPKVKEGGVLCGHDYLNGHRDGTDFGVREAVDEFFGGLGLKVETTGEDGAIELKSWHVVKEKDVWSRNLDESCVKIRDDRDSKVCVVTAYTENDPEWKRLGELTSETMRRYCERRGYAFRAYTKGFCESRPASWSKLLFVKDAMRKYEWVFWMDADAAVTGYFALETLMGEKDMVVATGGNFRIPVGVYLNMGVFLLRKGEFADWLIRELWRREHCVNERLWENKAFMELWDEGKLDGKVEVVHGRVFNSTHPGLAWKDYAWRKGDFVLHMVVASPKEKLEWFGSVLSMRKGEPLFFDWKGLFEEMEKKKENGVGVYCGADGSMAWELSNAWSGRMILAGQWSDWLYRRMYLMSVGNDRMSVDGRKAREASRDVADESLDWAYLDEPHDRVSVKEALEAWWPKVREGGLVCGHDYLEVEGRFGVKGAVDEFAKEKGRVVRSSIWKEEYPSWAIMK